MQNKILNFLFLGIFLSLIGFKSIANPAIVDTSKAVPYNKNKILKVRYGSGEELESSINTKFHVLDTALNGFQRSNIALNPYNPQRFLGIMISPQQPLIFNPFVKSTIRIGFDALRNTEILSDDMKYYQALKRYTNITYHFGRYHEQFIDVIHTQNVTKGLNLGFGIRRQAGDGQMARQAEYNSNFYIFGSFVTKNQRYGNYFNAGLNYLELDENGGLLNDKQFETSGRISNTLPVNINNDAMRYNSKYAAFHQHFDIGKYYKNNPLDSSETVKFKPLLRFSHTINYERKGYFYYTDPGFIGFANDNFYNKFNYSLSNTADTTGYSSLLNRVGLSTVIDEQLYEQNVRQLYMSVGGNFQSMRYTQQHVRNNYENTFVDGTIKSISRKEISAGLSGAYNVQGLYKNNYRVLTYVTQTFFKEQWQVGLKGAIQKASPELTLNNYYANNFNWSNDFSPSEYKSAAFVLQSAPYLLNAEAGYVNVFNYIGINGLALPYQYVHNVGLWQIKLNKDFNFGKFRLNNAIIYQRINGVDILRLPEWITYQSLYYHDRFFRNNALHLMIGLDIYYRSAYYGDAYMPATSLFYRQNEIKIGNYPILDPFINMQIKTIKIFLKYEYANRGLLQPAYYEVPHYPLTARVFRIGLSWSFFD